MITLTGVLVSIIVIGTLALGIWTPKWLSDLGADANSVIRN